MRRRAEPDPAPADSSATTRDAGQRGGRWCAPLRCALLLLGVTGALSCFDGPPRRPPHLALIVVDTLRADHLGVYGYARPTSPHIDALARGGVVFGRAFAPSSWTKPSVGSLFTSRLPSEHGAISFARQLSPALPTLAERLRDAGYRTIGVSANFVHVTARAGFSRGFAQWKSFSLPIEAGDPEALWSRELADGRQVHQRAPRAAEVNREVLRHLAAAQSAPVFLYVHYMEPHAPYAPPDPQRLAFRRDPSAPPLATNERLIRLAAGEERADDADRRGLVDLYDAEIAAVDEAIGALAGELARRGWAENGVLVIASDHGEEFGEHGGWFHALTLHRESLAVPLVIRDFRRRGGGEIRQEPVDLLDVPTTLLALAGVGPWAGARGRDLLAAGAAERRALVAELHPDPPFEETIRLRTHRLALLEWPWQAIASRDGSRALYRLDRETSRATPPDEAGAEGRQLVERLASLDRSLALDAGTTDGELPELDALRALGYVR